MLELENLADIPILYRQENSPKIATDEEALNCFRSLIQEVADQVRSRVRFYPEGAGIRTLFTMYSGIGYPMYIESPSINFIAELERERAQQLALESMKEFGFDVNTFSLDKQYSYGRLDQSARRVHVFPSQTIPGLEFVRTAYYLQNDGGLSRLRWQARDGAPQVQFRLRKPKIAQPRVGDTTY